MSEYTLSLRQLINSYFPPEQYAQGFQDSEAMIKEGSKRLFDFSYPFYNDNPEDKQAFQEYFVRHYYMYEIGQETPGLFKLRLQSLLYSAMPEIKRIYDTERMVFDPLNDYSETRTYTREDTGEQTNHVESIRSDSGEASSNDSSSERRRVFTNDTPQGELSDIDSGKYLSEYTNSPTESQSASGSTTKNDSSVTNDGADTIHNVQTHTETVRGKRGNLTYMEMIKQYRELAVNINGLLCNRLRDCFMYIL